MILPDKVYNFLKWICLIAIPALAVFIKPVFAAWGIPYAEPIIITINALAALIGTLIGVSQICYSKSQVEAGSENK
jgi:hypothetical protein